MAMFNDSSKMMLPGDTQQASTALAPYRLIDLSDEKGALCTKLFADMGADVIKVERPEGDPTRRIGPFYHDIPHPENSLFWLNYNTGKRSITLDIETEKGQDILKNLAKSADFLVECFPPGYLDSLGLGYLALSHINRRIIVTSISPFGQSGPYKDYKASDIVAMAMGGLMYTCGDTDRAPVRIGASQAYLQAGVQAAAATMIAHYYRETTGDGQHVDVSMQECITLTLDTAPQFWDLNEVILRRGGVYRYRGNRVLRLVFPCKDGFIAGYVHPGTGFEDLVAWMASEGMASDLIDEKWIGKTVGPGPQQLTAEEIRHVEEVVGDFLMAHTRAELYHEAQKRRILFCPVNTPADLFQDMQLRSREYFTEIEYPEVDDMIIYPGAPFKMSLTPWRICRRAPRLGEHNLDVYNQELGYSLAELDSLKRAKVI